MKNGPSFSGGKLGILTPSRRGILLLVDPVRLWSKCMLHFFFEICVVKGAELEDSNPQKKYKGRAVLDGSWVKDENYDVALFNEMGSSPANMQAGKVVDAYGLQEGYDIQQADAEAAYTQCELKGTETWVRLPEDRWPDEWFKTDRYGKRVCKYHDPVSA